MFGDDSVSSYRDDNREPTPATRTAAIRIAYALFTGLSHASRPDNC